MYQQAGKAKNADLLPMLQNLEIQQPNQFLEHFENFVEECPVCLIVNFANHYVGDIGTSCHWLKVCSSWKFDWTIPTY